jgi:hypothetical protein
MFDISKTTKRGGLSNMNCGLRIENKKLLLVAAGVVLAGDQDQSRSGFARSVGEGVQQGDDAGVSEGDSQGKRSGDGEGDNECDQ